MKTFVYALLASCLVFPMGAGAVVIYSQNFSGGNSFALTPGGSNTITTDTGSMVYSRTEGSVLGAMVRSSLPSVSGFFCVTLDLDATPTVSGSWGISMYDGAWRDIVAFQTYSDGLKILGGPNTQFCGSLGATNVSVFVNNSGSEQTYVSPSGGTNTIISGVSDIWVGETLMYTKTITGMNPANDFSQLRALFPGTSTIVGTFDFDNLIIKTMSEIAVEEVVYSQDFSGSNSFQLIPGNDSNTITTAGSMMYTRALAGGDLGAMVRHDLPAVSGLFCVLMDINVNPTFSGSWGISMYDGAFRDIVSFQTYSGGSKVIGGPDTQFSGNLGGVGLSVFVNNSDIEQTYTDPSGGTTTIISGVSDIWIGETLMYTKTITGMNSANSFTKLRILFPGTSEITGTFEFDNIIIGTLSEEQGFAAFAAQYGLSGTATNDYDGDGLNDFGEYVFSGNPTNSNDTGTQPVFDVSSGVYNFYLIGDNTITAHVLTNLDLVNGIWGTNSTVNISVNDGILSNYTDNISTGLDKVFIKLLVDSGQ